MKRLIMRGWLRFEAYAHAVDEYFARKKGDYQMASDALMRKLRCERKLEWY